MMKNFEKIILLLKQLIEKKFSIEKAINVLGSLEKENKDVGEFSRKCYDSLMKGYSLSSFIKMYFPNVKYERYIYLIQWGEICGNISFAFNLVCYELNANKKTIRQIQNVLMYPVVVIVIVIVLTIYIFMFCKNIYDFSIDVYVKTIFAFIFFVLYFLTFMNIIKRFLTKTDEHNFFQILNLFLENKIDIITSLKFISEYFCNKHNLNYNKIYIDLKNGEDVISVLNNNLKISELDYLILRTSFMSGDLISGIKTVYEKFEERFVNRRQIILSFVEPIMILGVAVYILSILITLVLPMITNFGGVL